MSRRGAVKSRSKSIVREPESAEGERLQKVLASAGVGSRRECEELILAGRVEIDRETVDQLGVRVDPQVQEVRLDGEVIVQSRKVYYLVNKPPGVVSTSRDPSGRQRVIDLVPKHGGRLFNVGRLDMASEGLILVTNDGPLADRLTHPRYGVEKTYHVQVAGQPNPSVLGRLQRGVHLAEGFAQVAHVKIKSRKKQSTILEMVLDEGRNREIRRLLARVGHKVLQLKRIAVGPIRMGEMPVGTYRELTYDEIRLLRQLVERGSSKTGPAKGRKSRGSRTARKPAVKSKTGDKKADASKTGGKERVTGRGKTGESTKTGRGKSSVRTTKGRTTKGRTTKGRVAKGRTAKGRVTRGRVAKGRAR